MKNAAKSTASSAQYRRCRVVPDPARHRDVETAKKLRRCRVRRSGARDPADATPRCGTALRSHCRHARRDARRSSGGLGARYPRGPASRHQGRYRSAPRERRLSPGAVAKRQGISDSYMRKLFEGEGTSFSQFVLGRRLEHARRMLTEPRWVHRNIASIAFDAGFGDLSYFNRTFKRCYGPTPSDMRDAIDG
jgi:AraC-like DNA-binding protein